MPNIPTTAPAAQTDEVRPSPTKAAERDREIMQASDYRHADRDYSSESGDRFGAWV